MSIDPGWPRRNGVRLEDRTPFKITQYAGTSSEERAQQLVCRSCGGERFHVAVADYFTAIRCIYCKTEHCIHEG